MDWDWVEQLEIICDDDLSGGKIDFLKLNMAGLV